MSHPIERVDPAIDRTIYVMPMFASFQVRDIAAATDWYEAIGFLALATIPGPDGTTAVVHLRRSKYQDLLLVPGEPAPGTTTVSFAAAGTDLTALAATLRAGAFADAGVDGPADTPWYTVDLTLTDADGNRIVFTAAREAELDEAKQWAETFDGDWIGKN
ncbi:VOC family protein [Nocardia yunnanensis]|uniref:VOC family protein n=1 Tax=Nocardia yunnanensis TaxID=2382165 RepID=A0A386ZA04_9NOCA|nr:VOC family protein [Nocardia yunnanensis]AYF74491.1 VOC family protein [Nocardia yunnanensis]